MGLAVLALYILAPAVAIFAVFLTLSILAGLEFYGLIEKSGRPVMKLEGLASIVVLMLGVWTAERCGCLGIDSFTLTVLLFVLLAFAQLGTLKTDQSVARLSHTLFGLLYIGGCLAFTTRLLLAGGEPDGRLFILYVIVVVKSTDIGAFTVGSLIGKHKFIPSISPAKSWEGVIGGLVVCTAVGYAFYAINAGTLGPFKVSLTHTLILSLLLGMVGIASDLIESMIKRDLAIKDSGTMIKGMGGILDVLDSLLPAMPIAWIYSVYFLERI